MSHKVYISTPTYYYSEPMGVYNHDELVEYSLGHGVEIEYPDVRQESLICRARNREATHFLRSDKEWLFTIDNDMICPPDALLRLLKHNRPIVGGLYRVKDYKKPRIAQIRAAGMVDEGILNEMEFLSTGAMLVHREVFETIIQEMPELSYDDEEIGDCWAFYQPFIREWQKDKRKYLSEDWAFCERARRCGYKLWADPTIPFGHIMPTPLFLPNHAQYGQVVTNIEGVASGRNV